MGAVSYVLDVVDEIPDRETARSPLEDALSKIVEQSNSQNKPITAVIGLYKNGSACTAAANVLRQKHGTPEVEGFRFETRRVNRPVKDENGQDTGKTEEVTALYVSYDKGKIVAGGREAWDRKMVKREQLLAEKRKIREAEKASAQGQPPAPSPTPPNAPTPTATQAQQATTQPPVNAGTPDGGKTPAASPKPQEAAPNAKK